MKIILKNLFNETEVFRKLDASQKKEVEIFCVSRKLQKGDVLVHYGEVWPHVILIGEGTIETFKVSGEGRSLGIRAYNVGETIWGHALFDGGPTPAILKAAEPSIVFQWPGFKLLSIIQNNNEALWELCLILHSRLRTASHSIEEFTFNSNANRLAKLLLNSFCPEKKSPSTRMMTLDQMAAKIGTTREVVCRLLYRFSNDKLIEVNRTQLTLLNVGEIRKIAEEKGCTTLNAINTLITK